MKGRKVFQIRTVVQVLTRRCGKRHGHGDGAYLPLARQ